MIVNRTPLADDDSASLAAGIWAGFDVDAILPVRAGYLAGLLERVAVETPAHLAADESRDARNTDALADVNADTLAWEDRGE